MYFILNFTRRVRLRLFAATFAQFLPESAPSTRVPIIKERSCAYIHFVDVHAHFAPIPCCASFSTSLASDFLDSEMMRRLRSTVRENN